MKQRLCGGLLTLLALGLAGTAGVYAQATTFTERFTDSFLLDDVNPCTGEPVELSGELLITIRTTIDTDGSFHGTYTLVPRHIVGVTPSGTTYRAVGGEREHLNEFNRGTAGTFTFTSTFNVISQGGGDNFSGFILHHVTVDEDGSFTTETFIDRVECRG